MKNQLNEYTVCNTRTLACLMLVAVMGFTSIGFARSLYVLGSQEDDPSFLYVYDVQPNGTLRFQTSHSYPRLGDGASGLTIDWDHGNLFMTYKNEKTIGVVGARAMQWLGELAIPGSDFDIGQAVYDHGTGRFYTTDEGQSALNAHLWDPFNSMILSLGEPSVGLSGAQATGILVDESRRLMYVASGSNIVRVYNVGFNLQDWQHVRDITLSHQAVVMALDEKNQLLYTGAGTLQDTYLVQYNLVSEVESEVQVDSAVGVMGLSVDISTGVVYVSTGIRGLPVGGKILVYNQWLNPVQSVVVDGYPTAMVMPRVTLGFNPLNLSVDLVSGTVINNGSHSASPTDTVEYEICITNDNLYMVSDVVITDALPEGLEYLRVERVSSDATDIYDPASRSLIYHIPTVNPNQSKCFRMFAKISESMQIGSTITNHVIVDSNEVSTSSSDVDLRVGFSTLGLTKTIVKDPNHLKVGDITYVDPGSYVTYQLCVSNRANNTAIESAVVVDFLPDHTSFVDATNGQAFGVYYPEFRAYKWRYDVVEPNFYDCRTIRVRIDDHLEPGTLISNAAITGSADTEAITVNADLVTKYAALALNMSIAPQMGDYDVISNQIRRGGLLTYVIDIHNRDLNSASENVLVVTGLPREMEFLSSPSNGINGVYDPDAHTYNWIFPVLLANESMRLELTVSVKQDAPLGKMVENRVIAICNGAPSAADSAFVRILGESGPEGIESELSLYVSQILCDNCLEEIMAILVLPDQVNMDDIDLDHPLVMTPGNAQAVYFIQGKGEKNVYLVYGRDGRVKVKGYFNRKLFLNAVEGQKGLAAVVVQGKLKSGVPFWGETTLALTDNIRQTK
jgi:uncharacterized repeat protein (TIGR01451 family)